MKNKIIKITTIILLIMTLTLTNFIFVGSSLISYAASGVETNHRNIEFDAYFTDSNNQRISSVDMANEGDIYLNMQVEVKQEGYFNGKITIEDSNFTLTDTDSSYVNKIEGNTITLNQINANTVADIKIKVELIKDEIFNLDNLTKTNTIKLEGNYYDSTERDIKIEAERNLELNLIENYSSDNIVNDIEVITNKIASINGEDKRVVQFLWNVGLEDNNYPMKDISLRIEVPTIDGKRAEVARVVDFNEMTYYDYAYDGSYVTFNYTNDPNDNNEIRWKLDGTEKIVLTFIYDSDVEITNQELDVNESVTLYDNKEITFDRTIILDNEEKDSIVTINSLSEQQSIYKGKLYAGLEKEYVVDTNIDINLARAITEGITIEESANQNTLRDVYTRTLIAKEQFDELFGQTGEITIYDENNQVIGRVTNSSQIDEDGNIAITYSSEPTTIRLETSVPIKEGTLELKNYKKLIPDSSSNIAELGQFGYITRLSYDGQEMGTVENNIILNETTTQSKFEVDKSTLSTVVDNDIEIRATLLSNSEQYDLYRNPVFRFELPEQVQNVEITGVELLYEDELSVANYSVDGRNIIVTLQGEQTKYKEATIEGAVLVINANLSLDRKTATADTNITMYYENENAHSYKNNTTIGTETQAIRIVAPKDLTIINSIPAISVETTGQEQNTSVNLITQNVPKQLEIQSEIINTTESIMNNVRILGTLPTNSEENNLGIQLINAIQVSKPDVTIYYTGNENATNDLNNRDNGWNTEFTQDAKKYLIIVDQLETGASVEIAYSIQIPENLEYNKQAEEYYSVSYVSSETSVENTLDSSVITLETGIGPKIEASLSATIGGQEITQNVKNGEVIQYNIKVSNTGSEDISNIEVVGQVPEGTTMVVPEENYEYTGASYYEELPDREYRTTIQNIEPGEVRTITYEVRVNSDTPEGTKLENTLQVTYNGVTSQSEAHTLTTERGNLRVTVKRVTDSSVDLYTAGVVQYFAIIENISDEELSDVKVHTDFSDNLEVQRVTLITGMEKEDGEIYRVGEEASEEVAQNDETIGETTTDIVSEDIEYSDEISIGSLQPGENKVLSYDMLITRTDDNSINFAVTASDGEKDYKSNNLQDEVRNFDIELTMEDGTESEYLNSGDVVTYIINVKNNSTAETEGLIIRDSIPSQLSVQQILVNGEQYEVPDTNELEIPCDIEAGGETQIEIQAVVNYSEGRDTAEPITNVATAEVYGETIATTSEINHIILANEGSTGNEDNNLDDNDIAAGNRTITGVAWYDANADGILNGNEEKLSGITVRLLNVETNNYVRTTDGDILEATTNDNGVYVLDGIGNGRYIAIFGYDDTRYTLTRYKVGGATESENSDVLMNTLTIGDTEEEVASTDILEINNNNISDINIGLALLQNYDLQLDKYVSRILLQNSKGTTVREYQDETMAKVELDAKQINGTTAIIEYQIRVTNVGDVTGYVRRIVDYLPSDLTFSSEMNKDWYQTGNGIYTAVLSNEPIAPGESKTVTLTVVKNMNENNTGRINNRAEIAEDYNDLGIADVNSTPGNQDTSENDLGSADVILSIRTGAVTYISIVVAVIIILTIIGIMIWKKKNHNKKI